MLKAMKLSFYISYKASKWIMLFRLVVVILTSFIPLLNSLSIKNIVNALSISKFDDIPCWFLILGATQIISVGIGKVTSYLAQLHSDHISFFVTNDIINKINELDVSYFDNPELYNEVKNVTQDIGSIPSLIWNVMSIVQCAIQFSYAFFIIKYLNWWIPFIIVLSCIPNFILDKRYSIKIYTWSRSTTGDVRKINYIYNNLTDKYFSKDIRVHFLFDYLKNKYKKEWTKWHNSKRTIYLKQLLVSLSTIFVPYFIVLGVSAYTIILIINQHIGVGDFTYYISIMGQLTTSTLGIIGLVTSFIQDQKKYTFYEKFKEWEAEVDHSGSREINKIEKVEFRNVSFTYPHTETQVLDNISFVLNEGDKIAIVGCNGAGKSTIIKLIMGLYKPSSGQILINGRNISDFNYEKYCKLISTMFQDYVNYCYSLRENLLLGDINNSPSDSDIIAACKKSGAYDFIKNWENGLSTYLTKSFDIDGKELSGGEWQKIAIARFFNKKCCLRIMDEPTSSLDLASEDKIFTEILNAKETLVLVSHRAFYMKKMTKIIVVENGKIIGKGTHEELLITCDYYRQMQQYITDKIK